MAATGALKRWQLNPGHPDPREGRIPAGRDGVNQQLIRYRLSVLSDDHLATNLEKAVRLPVKFVIRSRSQMTPRMVSRWYRGIDHRGTRRAATGCSSCTARHRQAGRGNSAGGGPFRRFIMPCRLRPCFDLCLSGNMGIRRREALLHVWDEKWK